MSKTPDKTPEAMSPPTTKHDTAPSATSRRWKNALLVMVAVLAAVGITVILNYVVYWQYRGLSPEARSLVRYDLTATRRYSLSEQSRGVLESIDKPHRLVTMLGSEGLGDEQRQRVRDLVDEYARANKLIQTQHIDLDTQTAQRDALLAEMDAMFTRDTEPIRASIADGLEKLDQYEEIVDKIESGLKQIVDSGLTMRPQSIQNQRLADLHSQYLRLQDQAESIRTMRDDMLGSDWRERLRSPGSVKLEGAETGDSLPDYSRLMAAIQRYVIQFAGQTLPDTPAKADQLRRGIVVNPADRAELQQPALTAQNTLAALTQQVPTLLRQLKPQIDPLLGVTPPLRYEDARAVLNDKPCVLLTSDGDARVLPAELLFRGAASADDTDAQTSDLFVGEEALTGALISMRLDPPPMVVFIRSNTGQRALSSTSSDGQRLEGVYDHVTKRLLSMDFEVVEWENPLQQDPPTPRPGQRVVWVSLPYFPPNTANRSSLDHTRKNKVAEFLDERLAEGDGALVMLSYNPDTDPRLATPEQKDSLVELLSTFGLEAQLYHSATRLDIEDEDPSKSRYSDNFIVRTWPDSAIVGEALNGIDTFFRAPMPIAFEDKPGTKQRALVTLNQPSMYVQRTVPDPKTQTFTPEPDAKRDSVTFGAAAERDEGRVIAIGDAYWAVDAITSDAVLPDGTRGPGLADKPGARIAFPGNSDLFVNSICWLAKQEDLIAASPRTQDIRRIEPVSDNTLRAYRVAIWAGMPVVIFAIGLTVGLMRRRA